MFECGHDNSEIMNWQICVLCQKNTTEKLVNPENQGYESLSKNIKQFHDLGQLPQTLNNSVISKLSDLYNVFRENKALWHRSCYLKYNNSKLQRAQLRAQKDTTSDRVPVSLTRSLHEVCLFCTSPCTQSQPLITVTSKTVVDTILECANILNDVSILGKISTNHDLIALPIRYHNKCILGYKNKCRAAKVVKQSDTITKNQALRITLSGLIDHINQGRDESNENNFFSISDLAELQRKHMKDLGFEYFVHTTRLKKHILAECPYLISCDRKGLPSLITFKEDLDSSVRSNNDESKDEGGVLAEASNIVRSDIFDNDNNDSKTNNVVPGSLLALVTMILYGPKSQPNDKDNRICSFISELLAYNAVRFKKRGETRRHRKQAETSVPVYLAAKLYAETRKKTLIDATYNLGISISYATLHNILTDKGNSVCEMYHREGVVCPPKMCKGCFTTAAVDNIDHNPSSTTAKTSFHGTAITLMQHKMPGEVGLSRDPLPTTMNDESSNPRSKVMELPTHYSIVPPCFMNLKKDTCSRSDICTLEESNNTAALIEETKWLDSTMTDDFKPWPAHHAAGDRDVEKRHRTEVSVLPLFTEHAHTPTMMIHSIDVVMKAIKYLNPDQVPVLVADQPLYALLKQVQFTMPEKYGESDIFIMMGGLHIEMAALKVIGQWLRESGWTEALVEAKVTTQGRSEAMLHATNVSRTRYALQVTAAALYSLLKKAYQSSLDDNDNEAPLSFDQWCEQKISRVPQFNYWHTGLNLIITVLRFVRSIRSGNFSMYLESIRQILPWFFALDHVNYARWLSVHLKDLANLKDTHPELLNHFENGQFVARKSNRKFSGMALDQAHEQMNAILKGDGGLIGLTENPAALRKWLLAGPELTEMIDKFEHEILYCNVQNDGNETDANHLSDTTANKNKFITDVKSLETIINNLGSPFLEQSTELYNIDTKNIAPREVVDTIFTIEKKGEEQYTAFCMERLHTKADKSLLDPIKLNKYPLLSTPKKKTESKMNAKIGGLKNDCSLFSKLYIATCEHREGNLDSFFAHENQSSPPSLSSLGKLRSGTKSDLLKSITTICESATLPNVPQVSVKILDGSAIVHMLSPGQSKTFGEYAENIFIPFLCRELTTASRLDVVWDRYRSDSLKNATREKRGTGQRTLVTATTKIPKGWTNFLRDSSNKEGLFSLLSAFCHSYNFDDGKEVYITDGENILTNVTRDTLSLAPCNHEEADTRIMVHASDAVDRGFTKLMIRTVDTDVVVLAVAHVQTLPQLEELWVHIGTGKHHQYLSCHDIATALGPQRARVLPLFHAFTGCDTVSSFNGKGKRSAFEAWEVFPDLTVGFESAIEGRIEEAMASIEKYVVTLYDRSASCTSVNECRKYLFTKKDRQIEHLPPTKAALYQHFLRAIYQGVHVWGQLAPAQNLPCPSTWGWTKVEKNWEPTWTDLPVAAEACLEIVRCKCKKQCRGWCNCKKRQLKCSDLCLCSGSCNI